MKKTLLLALIILFAMSSMVLASEEFYFVGDWAVSKTEDPITDELQLAMGNQVNDTHTLVVRFVDSKLDIMSSTKILESSNGVFRDVIYRFDDEEPVKDNWFPSLNNDSLFFAKFHTTYKEFITKMMNHDQLAFAYWPRNLKRETVVYSLDGFKEAIEPYLDDIGLGDLK